MSFERLSEILSEATPAAGWIDGQPTRYSGSEVHRMVWDAKIAALAPDAIALLEEMARWLEGNTMRHHEFVSDWLQRLDALCGDDREALP